MSSNIVNGVIYARVSSSEQREQGFSIEAQQALLREYSKKHNIIIIKEFLEVHSAKTGGRRSEFNSMLDFIKRYKDDNLVILVEKTDRLYRNFEDRIILDKLDVPIHLVKESTIYRKGNSSSDELMHDVILAVAKHKVNLMSEEIKKGIKQKILQGGYPGKAPFGYINNVSNGKNVISKDPDYSAIITSCFSKYANGLDSIEKVTEDINRDIVHSNLKRVLKASTLHRILSNTFYIGKLNWKGKTYDGSHDPLVSKELFNKVQIVLAKRSQSSSHQVKEEKLFQGMIKCSVCGRTLTPDVKKGKYIYYFCKSSVGKNATCSNKKYIREYVVTASINKFMKNWKIPTSLDSLFCKHFDNMKEGSKDSIKSSLSREKGNKTTFENKLDKLLECYIDEMISKEKYDRKKTIYENQIRTCEDEIRRLMGVLEGYSSGYSLGKLINVFIEKYSTLSIHLKKSIINIIFKSIYYIDNHIECEMNEPFSYFKS